MAVVYISHETKNHMKTNKSLFS